MTPLGLGQRVRYHGSLSAYHGDGTLMDVSDYDHPAAQSDDGHRYVILLDPCEGRDFQFPVSNVRRQSFTALGQVVEA